MTYHSPHKLRQGHTVFGPQAAQEISNLKAVSMNPMHGSIDIADSIYAVLSDKDMQERIAQLGQGTGTTGVDKDHIKADCSNSCHDWTAHLSKN
ncbi:MAG TPA: hypothetical protein VIK33_12530 [Anaerolineae bacterium]